MWLIRSCGGENLNFLNSKSLKELIKFKSRGTTVFGFVESRVLTRPGFVYVKGVWVLLWCFVVFCRVLSGARKVLSDWGREREQGLGAIFGEDLYV